MAKASYLKLCEDLGRPEVPDANAAILARRGKAHAAGVPRATHAAVRGLRERLYPLVLGAVHRTVQIGLVAISHGHQVLAIWAEARVVDRDWEGDGHDHGHRGEAEDLDRLVVVAQEEPQLARTVLANVQSVVHVSPHVILTDGGALGKRKHVQLWSAGQRRREGRMKNRRDFG